MAVASPAFLRNTVLIPGGLGLCPDPAVDVGRATSVSPLDQLALTQLQEAADL